MSRRSSIEEHLICAFELYSHWDRHHGSHVLGNEAAYQYRICINIAHPSVIRVLQVPSPLVLRESRIMRHTKVLRSPLPPHLWT
jgi:hypothetical protein